MTMRILTVFLIAMLFSITGWASDFEQGETHLNGYRPQDGRSLKSATDYTVLDALLYQQVVRDSRLKVQQILEEWRSQPIQEADARMGFFAKQLMDIPFIYSGAIGEGDWQSTSSVYQPGAVHVKQDPVYRLDGLNCQTFVQTIMALFYSHYLDEFDRTILKINYGAAGNPSGEIIHYYNRNNFIDGDWNPVNRNNGWLTDVTAQGNLSPYAKKTIVNITRQHWFSLQSNDLQSTVRVLDDSTGSIMAKRFSSVYSQLNYPHFDLETVSIAYIPKEYLVIKQPSGYYKPNERLLDKIPTPAVLEIVRDARKWTIGDKNIKEAIGSELSISHMGILYRKNFSYGDLIYQKTSCLYNEQDQKVCFVTPVFCREKMCNKLMFVHSSNAWPNGYYWYKNSDNQYACTSTLPNNVTRYTRCNRVRELPLFDYLTTYQYGSYALMDTPSIIGIHVERLTP